VIAPIRKTPTTLVWEVITSVGAGVSSFNRWHDKIDAEQVRALDIFRQFCTPKSPQCHQSIRFLPMSNQQPAESRDSGSGSNPGRVRPQGVAVAIAVAICLVYVNWPKGHTPPPRPIAANAPVIKSIQEARRDNVSADATADGSEQTSAPVIAGRQSHSASATQNSTDAGVRIEPARSGNPKLSRNPQTKTRPPPKSDTRSPATLIPQVTLKNQDGDVIYQGPIDLQPTLDRIEKGERNSHRNDGTVFQNRERKLTRKPSGYYHEYVVPTPNQQGPGPQRLILGQGGEVYYTADHYRTFRKIDVRISLPASQN
jgi:ribonuclease T1